MCVFCACLVTHVLRSWEPFQVLKGLLTISSIPEPDSCSKSMTAIFICNTLSKRSKGVAHLRELINRYQILFTATQQADMIQFIPGGFEARG